jgi:hypothetical protein
MFARVASFEGGDIERIRQMNEERRDAASPGLPEGVRRILVLNDGEANRRLFIAFFDSREAVDAAEARFEAMGDEVGEDVRGRRKSVDVYEVAFDGEP